MKGKPPRYSPDRGQQEERQERVLLSPRQQKFPLASREVIDKVPEMGYSKGTKGAASRTAPVCYREVTVTFGRVRRLLLFVILENQSNDS